MRLMDDLSRSLRTSMVIAGLLAALVVPGTVAAVRVGIGSDDGTTPVTRDVMRDAGIRGFEENRGQVRDEDGRVCNEILYTAQVRGARLYIRRDGISHVFMRQHASRPATADTGRGRRVELLAGSMRVEPQVASDSCLVYRMDMQLVGARSDVRIHPLEQASATSTHYRAHAAAVRGVRAFARLVFEGVYDHVDLVMAITDAGLKYAFIVRPGGDIADIRLRYDGATEMAIDADGALRVGAPVGGIREDAPTSWQIDAETGIAEETSLVTAMPAAAQLRRSAFMVHDGDVMFHVVDHDRSRPLVIDPWATYLGGSANERAHAVTTDISGNVIVTGVTESLDYPVLAGRQMIRSLDADMFLAKYTRTGSLLWSTYYGAGMYDEAHAIVTDDAGNIFISGRTWSADLDVPHAGQPVHGGASDIVLASFSPTGDLRWATFHGGLGHDQGLGLARAHDGDLLVCGISKGLNLPLLGAEQSIYGGGLWDATVARFSADGVLRWSTLLGGDLEDVAVNLATDRQGNVVVVGWTTSRNFPTRNAVRSSKDDTYLNGDGFVTKYDARGRLLWSTLHGSDAVGGDVAMDVAVDSKDDLIVVGVGADSGFPILNPPVPPETTWRGPFITKFSSNGAILWSTKIGRESDWGFQAVSIGVLDTIYIAGDTRYANFPTLRAMQSDLRGVSDAVVGKLAPSGVPLWLTLYGGTGREYFGDLAVDLEGNVVFTGWTDSDDFPLFTPVQQFNEGAADGFVVHLGPDGFIPALPVPALRLTGPTWICEDDTAVVTFRLTGAPPFDIVYSIDAVRDTMVVSSGFRAVLHLTPTRTTTVRLHSIRDARGTSLVDDSLVVIVVPRPPQRVTVRSVPTPCEGDSVVLRAGPAAHIRWSTGATTDSIVVGQSGRYAATLWTAEGCATLSDTVTVVIAPRPRLQITPSGTTSVCAGIPLTLDAGPGHASYLWTTGATTQAIAVTGTGWYGVTVTTSEGCSARDSIHVTRYPAVRPTITGNRSICAGDSTTLDADSGHARYRWNSGDTTRSIRVGRAGVYSVVVTDSNGCTGSAGVTVLQTDRLDVRITGASAVCTGDSTELDAGAGHASYLWSTGDTTRVLRVRSAGMYRVLAMSPSGCSGADSMLVTMHTRPQPRIEGRQTLCAGDSTVLTLRESFPAMFWSTGSRERTITVRTSGMYAVTVIDSAGCSGTDSIPITVRDEVRPRISGNRVLCEGASIVLDAGAGFASYAWTNGSTARTCIVDAPGTHVVTVRDSLGCPGRDSVTIMLRPRPQPHITGIPHFCEGSMTTLDAGPGYARYRWSTGDTTRMLGTTRAGWHVVTVWDVDGCEGKDSCQTTVLTRPAPTISGSHQTCDGDTVDLDAGAEYVSYAWFHDGVPFGGNARRLRAGSAGAYEVRVIDSAGCEGRSPTHLLVITAAVRPVIVRTGDTLRCTTGEQWQWYRNDTLLAGMTRPDMHAGMAGRYHVATVDSNGCHATSDPWEIAAVTPSAVLSLQCPSTEPLEPGFHVAVPLALLAMQHVTTSSPRALSLYVRVSGSSLLPLFPIERRWSDGPDQVLQVRVVRDSTQTTGVLVDLSFAAALGDTPCTDVRIDSLWWSDGEVLSTLAVSGCSICIRTCDEGGARLFHDTPVLGMLRNHPNPFNATTRLDYTLIEEGQVRLFVLDALGRTVAVLADEHAEPGSHTRVFDAAALPSGRYACILQTPSHRLVRWMHLLR